MNCIETEHCGPSSHTSISPVAARYWRSLVAAVPRRADGICGWVNPISHEAILDRWARQPVDFAPGERWQYSNTGYGLAGVILEKVAGQSQTWR